MSSKKTAFLLRKAYIGLISLLIFITSGCLLNKKVIPEYFPETSKRQDKQQIKREATPSSPLVEAISEIKATTKEAPLSSSNATLQKKEALHKENLVKSMDSSSVKVQKDSSTQVQETTSSKKLKNNNSDKDR